MKTYEPTQLRWQRRYGGRRWVMGVPVSPEPIGAMVDDFIAFDIATRRVWHVLRAPIRRLATMLERAVASQSKVVGE